jgi:hypothetical protein
MPEGLMDTGSRIVAAFEAAWCSIQARHAEIPDVVMIVEQSIGHLGNARSLRRWRGLPYRVRHVFRATAALVSLGRWLPESPPTPPPAVRPAAPRGLPWRTAWSRPAGCVRRNDPGRTGRAAIRRSARD